MLSRSKNRIIVAILLIFGTGSITSAQSESALGSFTPYSLFGIGDIAKQGSSINRSMGGIGVGVRDNRYINYLNPASITKRDTLAFMFDFGLYQKNTFTTDGDRTAPFNTLNISHITLTAPIYRKSAFIIGVSPVSNVGYNLTDMETDMDIISEQGNILYSKYGNGYISKIFLGTSAVLFENLSVAVEGSYYFGNIKHHSNINFIGNGTESGSSINPGAPRRISTGKDNTLKSFGGKVALQYEKNISDNISLTLGGTWSVASNLTGNQIDYIYSQNNITTQTDTIRHNLYSKSYDIPSELGLGLSIRKRDKWMIGLDYVRQDWSDTKFDDTPGVDFKTAASNSFRMGFEYIPNRYDVRYYMRRMSYRGGVYYDQGYMKLSGNQINAMGITLGTTLPIPPFYNAVSVSVDMGQRGTLNNNLLRERYVMFNINISLHEIWFRKLRYD